MVDRKKGGGKDVEGMDGKIVNELEKDGGICKVEVCKGVGVWGRGWVEGVGGVEREGFIEGYRGVVKGDYVDG